MWKNALDYEHERDEALLEVERLRMENERLVAENTRLRDALIDDVIAYPDARLPRGVLFT